VEFSNEEFFMTALSLSALNFLTKPSSLSSSPVLSWQITAAFVSMVAITVLVENYFHSQRGHRQAAQINKDRTTIEKLQAKLTKSNSELATAKADLATAQEELTEANTKIKNLVNVTLSAPLRTELSTASETIDTQHQKAIESLGELITQLEQQHLSVRAIEDNSQYSQIVELLNDLTSYLNKIPVQSSVEDSYVMPNKNEALLPTKEERENLVKMTETVLDNLKQFSQQLIQNHLGTLALLTKKLQKIIWIYKK